jgi:hypothetical protein
MPKTIRVNEVSSSRRHGVIVYLSGRRLFRTDFYSPGFSSQGACQQAERTVIDMLVELGVGDENRNLVVQGFYPNTHNRPYLLAEFLQQPDLSAIFV